MSSKRSLGPLPLLYPEPALLVCTYDVNGKANAMVAAWGGICCSEPLCLTVSVRPERWTFESLLARKAFTVCIPSEALLVKADFLGIASGRRYDKLALSSLTPVASEKVDAPLIAECPVALECRLLQSVPLGAHTMMVGEILDVLADEDCLEPGGRYPDIHKVKPLVFDSGSRAYYSVGQEVGKAFSAGKALLKGE